MDGNVMLNVVGGPPLSVPTRSGASHGLAFDPTGRWLAVPDETNAVVVWNVNSLGPVGSVDFKRLIGPKSAVVSLAFAPDGETLAAGAQGGEVVVWNVVSRIGVPRPINDSLHPSTPAVATNDGTTLMWGTSDGRVVFWDARRWQTIAVEPGHRGLVSKVMLSPDQSRLLTIGEQDGVLLSWEVASHAPTHLSHESRDPLAGLSGGRTVVRSRSDR
jgi:WD40 repeat protein